MKNKGYYQESGNVLFLILIAVALFAALSYAVTQSTRSGTGSTDREQSLLGSATLTQYPTALRTAIVRMVLAGRDVRGIWFEPPSDFGTLDVNRLVFHPEGGGASFQEGATDVMASPAAGGPTPVGTWYHNMQLEIPNVGKSGTGGNDLIAFLPGVNDNACLRINQQMGIPAGVSGCTYNTSGIPTVTLTDGNITKNMENDVDSGIAPNIAAETLSCGTAFNAKASGCFYDATLVVNGKTGNNVFYSVIIER